MVPTAVERAGQPQLASPATLKTGVKRDRAGSDTTALNSTWISKEEGIVSLARVVGSFIALSVALGLARPPAAEAVQAGASLSVIPDNWGFLTTNQTFDVLIRANNTSSDTPSATFPGDGSGAKAASLTGPITVTLGCADDACSTLSPGVLAFVPVGGSGACRRTRR